MVTGNWRPGDVSSVVTNVKSTNILEEADIATKKMCTLSDCVFLTLFL